MRRRAVELRLDGWEDMVPTLFANQLEGLELEPHGASKKQMLIAALVCGALGQLGERPETWRAWNSSRPVAKAISAAWVT